MAILSCKRLRQVVAVAGVFFVAGIFLEVFTHIFSSPDNQMFVQPFVLGLVLSSPVVMLLAMVVSLIPGLKLRDCT
jgi:membrane glycosyltransferase